MADTDTPRSLGYGSPRDDRFHTPRSINRGNSSNSDEWQTPRFETPRYGPNTARSGCSSDGENQFATPRAFDPPLGDYKRSRNSNPNLLQQTYQQQQNRSEQNSYYDNQRFSNPNTGRSTGSRESSPRLSDSYDQYTQYTQYNATAAAQPKYSNDPTPPYPLSRERKDSYSPRLPPQYEHKQNAYGSSNQYQQPPYPSSVRTSHNESQYKQSVLDISDDYSIDQMNEQFGDIGIGMGTTSSSSAHYSGTEQDVEDIFSFARHGRSEEIEKLLTKGLPVDVRDHNGNTILTVACQNGNKRVAKTVLRRGANINHRNHKGNTPLHYCYHYGYGETLGQYMIEKGADPNARNNMGKITYDGI